MPGLDPGIHLSLQEGSSRRGWIAGSSPAMTSGVTMSPELLFWYGLLLKMAMTATIVVAASVAVERSGPFIGALIAALPTAAGAAYIILAAEHPPALIGASGIRSDAAEAGIAIFNIT